LLAGEGQLEARVMSPDFYSEKVGENEYAEFPMDFSYEYRTVDCVILQELIGKGVEWIERGSVIQGIPIQRTLKRTDFSDLVVTSEEVTRFEHAYLNESPTGTAHTSDETMTPGLVSKTEKEDSASQSVAVRTYLNIDDLKWKELNITFSNNGDALLISARKLQETVHFAQAGFLDGRKKNLPDKNWIFLKRLAGTKGRISDTDPKLEGQFKKNMDKYAQTVRARLKAMFPNIVGDPLPLDGLGAWKAAFAIKDLDPSVYGTQGS
jgi:hypothetical protein